MKYINKKQVLILFYLVYCIYHIIFFVVFFRNIYTKDNNTSNSTLPNEEVYTVSFSKNIYYLGTNETVKLNINNPDNNNYKIVSSNEEIVQIENEYIKGITNGNTEVSILLPNNKEIKATVYVVKGMVNRPLEFNLEKDYITCEYFTDEENQLLDLALLDRLNEVSYPSRASVVEAARFLTLNFEFRIPYFYENGRLVNYGGKLYVDGEGRYYHKGLYLSTSKYNDLAAQLMGPAMWGCKLKNLTNARSYNFISGNKYPNGLDCSGFISWVLYNGGFDIGDVGAGDISFRNDDLYDLGEKRKISLELLDSNEVKVGDLIAYSGHMAMIVGIDDDDFYISESLPNLKGVVIRKYTKEKLINTFSHIMLMDEVYKNDGNLSNMWY